MSTLATLKVDVARDLRDPSARTFTEDDIEDIIAQGMVEIGRIAPRRFQEDIDLVADALEYQLLTDDFSAAVPEIEVSRVELWDTTQTPNRPVRRLNPMSAEYINFSEAGWFVRDGILEVPSWVPLYVEGAEADYLIRVWGWAPYAIMDSDDDVVPLSYEREQALRAFAKSEALRRLLSSRELYTQWQTRSGNTDVSPAALMNDLNLAEESWRRKSRALTVLRDR